MSLALGQQACADLLGVSRRTVRYWDAGRSRVPWSAVRLLRILRAGELPSDHWPGWRVQGDQLITPAGVAFRSGEFTWWALTCLQARSWQRSFDRAFCNKGPARPSAGDALPAGSIVIDGGALDLVPLTEGAGDARESGEMCGQPPRLLPAAFGGAGDAAGRGAQGAAVPCSRSEPGGGVIGPAVGLVLSKTKDVRQGQNGVRPSFHGGLCQESKQGAQVPGTGGSSPPQDHDGRWA
jgi:hypothetical protein